MHSYWQAAALACATLLVACSKQAVPRSAEPASAGVDARLCAACHPKEAATYKHTGMGRSFHRATDADLPPPAQAAYFHKASGLQYNLLAREGKLFLRRGETGANGSESNVAEREIHYVLGSGRHARTYLHRTPQNRLIELPVNWYSADGGFLAMSPGYDRPGHMDMRRAIGYECMFCHNGYPEAPQGLSPSTADPIFLKVPEGIDCQRCHGAGRAHVEAAQQAKPDSQAIRSTILHPGKLPAARQGEVCMQCHLETTSFPLPASMVRLERGVFSYDARESLTDFIFHFDHAGREDKFEIASSAYRLRQSKCFSASGGRLTCLTCHNPHAEKTNYDAACMQCHSSIAKSKNHEARSDCGRCHMPKRRTEDVVHVAVTDHRIQRPGRAADALAARQERHEQMGSTSYRGEVKPYYPDEIPELYTAMAQVANRSNLAAGAPRLKAALTKNKPRHPAYYLQMADALAASGDVTAALPYYGQALAIDPEYLPAWRSQGAALARVGKWDESRATLEAVLRRYPQDAPSWLDLARVHRQQGRVAESGAAASKAIENEPELADAYGILGEVRTASGDRKSAEDAYRGALRQQPDHADSHTNLAGLLAADGRQEEAGFHYRAAIRHNARLVAAHFGYALLLANLRQYTDALAHARQAVALEPSNVAARDLLGNLHAAQGQWREAAAQYREALRLSPGLGRAQLGLGTALAGLRDLSGARFYLGQASRSADGAVRAEALELLASMPR